MHHKHHPTRRLLPTHLAPALLILVLVGCQAATDRSESTEAPTATAQPSTPTSVATLATRPAEPEPTILPGPVQYGSAAMVNLNLPGGWVVERLDGVALVERLGDPPDEKSAALEKVRAAAGAETEVLWATSTETIADQSYSSHLLVSLLPRHGLSLASYVSAVAAALTENEGVSVERTGIVYDVREDGLPLGILQYRFDAGKSEQETGGYQIVQFDANAHNLVVLTFTTSGSGLSEQIPVFHEIAASVHSGEVE